MSDDVTITLELRKGYQFTVDFGDEALPPLLMDEPPPVGEGAGPNATRMLAAAVGNCLAASAMFCLRKARIDVQSMQASVRVTEGRNEQGRLRITAIDVTLHPHVAEADRSRMSHCLEIFEDYCVVTQSVRGGIDVQVTVEPAASPHGI